MCTSSVEICGAFAGVCVGGCRTTFNRSVQVGYCRRELLLGCVVVRPRIRLLHSNAFAWQVFLSVGILAGMSDGIVLGPLQCVPGRCVSPGGITPLGATQRLQAVRSLSLESGY